MGFLGILFQLTFKAFLMLNSKSMRLNSNNCSPLQFVYHLGAMQVFFVTKIAYISPLCL
ncbi:hypothetical protein N481_11295 [Pseudoalteromonas luteoviolacea S4047-1]|uniref:Uncharacterized protein n=1 Tax=Pseudoalteromonas luteoviolacea S4054 TaxID=1129367 RepID=A0A0F6AIH8_9GAMM|nr:hypothetical protein N479_04885 [Pseudoalteromonas luteoviolacea S4054]KZN73687.1 hypothetical protein N481_11295 [Pseudoalteromonas luteoviolacea S4047-1]